jgi:hypothetical protein
MPVKLREDLAHCARQALKLGPDAPEKAVAEPRGRRRVMVPRVNLSCRGVPSLWLRSIGAFTEARRIDLARPHHAVMLLSYEGLEASMDLGSREPFTRSRI